MATISNATLAFYISDALFGQEVTSMNSVGGRNRNNDFGHFWYLYMVGADLH